MLFNMMIEIDDQDWKAYHDFMKDLSESPRHSLKSLEDHVKVSIYSYLDSVNSFNGRRWATKQPKVEVCQAGKVKWTVDRNGKEVEVVCPKCQSKKITINFAGFVCMDCGEMGFSVSV